MSVRRAGPADLADLARLHAAAFSPGWSAAEIAATIIADVRTHIGKQKVHDDITLVVLKHR